MFWQRAVAFLCALVGLLGIAGGASLLLKRGFDAYYRRAYPIRYEELIGQACEERSLDPALGPDAPRRTRNRRLFPAF